MAIKQRICKLIFNQLLQAVKEEFERRASLKGEIPEGKGAAYHGFGEFKDTHKTTLMGSILFPEKNKDLAEYISLNKYQNISRKHLYNLERDFDKLDDYDSLAVDGIFLNILAKYIFYKTFISFIEEDPRVSKEDETIQKAIIGLKKGELSEQDLAVQYIGFYYSYKDGIRKSLRLWVNFYNRSEEGYPAKLTGAHVDEMTTTDIVYTGFGKDLSTCSFIELMDEKRERPFTLVGFRGHFPTKDLNFIRFSASAVSQYGYPYSFEVLFARLDSHLRNQSSDFILENFNQLKHIDFYLQTQRRHFRVPQRIINNLSEIKAKGTKAKKVENIPGTYRIWNISYAGELVQTKLVIHDDFRAELHTIAVNRVYRKQTCLLNISLVREKLCVSAHIEEGISIINYAILDLNTEGNKPFLSGVYCGININGTADFVSERLVLIPDKSNFSAARITPKELVVLIKKESWVKDILSSSLFSNTQFKGRHSFLRKVNILREILIHN